MISFPTRKPGIANGRSVVRSFFATLWSGFVLVSASTELCAETERAFPNLIQNPGFEEGATGASPAGWSAASDSQKPPRPDETGSHSGRRSLALEPHSSVEQTTGPLRPGAYLARFWAKSSADQTITCVLSDRERPWSGYSLTEAKVPHDQWIRLEAFCSVNQPGRLTLQLGGMSQEFRAYHGPQSEMKASILIDDVELVQWESAPDAPVSFWDGDPTGEPLAMAAPQKTIPISKLAQFRAGPLLGKVRSSDGAILLATHLDGSERPQGILVPAPGFAADDVSVVQDATRKGIRVQSHSTGKGYTAWISPKGLISVEAHEVPEFRLEGVQIDCGILPSLVGSDLVYSPPNLPDENRICLPSTQWWLGLEKGGAGEWVAVWDSPAQAATLGLSGKAAQRTIESLTLGTATGGFSLAWIGHPSIWHHETLREDYLGDYVASDWQRPFPARWTAHFFVSPGGKRAFHRPYNQYSFPFASAKTRMWGAWFEDWNHYPFYFDGLKTVMHFEKSFIPQGDAIFYFLEPAAADLLSPCDVVEHALGHERAAVLFDWDGNALGQLKYSTPPLFMYDRPVCATTTRLSHIKQEEKPTVGVNLSTHLYEFIREIRGRVGQFGQFFANTEQYLTQVGTEHPDLLPYLAELKPLITEGREKAKKAETIPLSEVQAKTDAMKKLLQQGKGDGFDCGNLDVRNVAGEQDDLCRRLNRLVLHLSQTAALQAGGSPEKAAVALHLWVESRTVLRQPSRWEARRTLYFFEP